MKILRGAICFLGLLALGVALELNAEDEGEKEEEKVLSAGEQIEAAIKGYEEGMREYFVKVREAKTDEERRELMRPDAGAAAREVLDLAKREPDDPKARGAVFWAAQNGGRDEGVMSEVIAVVTNHYLSAEGVEDLCLTMGSTGGEKAVGLLEIIRKESAHKPARGAAIFALGKVKADEGDEEAAEALFEEVVSGFPDAEVRGRGLAEMAEKELFVMRNLVVGKVAPEIEGVKADGEVFKLSDYRGKVVVLDFFGHW